MERGIIRLGSVDSLFLFDRWVVGVTYFLKHISHFSLFNWLLFLMCDDSVSDFVDVEVSVYFVKCDLGPKVLQPEFFGFSLALPLQILEFGFLFTLDAAWVVIFLNLHLELVLFFKADFVAALQIAHLFWFSKFN